MKQHPDDAALIAAQSWRPGRCAVCKQNPVGVTEVGHIEQASGPGYPICFCRTCLAYDLTLQRAAAPNPRLHAAVLPAVR